MNTIYETDRLLLTVCTNNKAGLVTEFYRNNYSDFSQYEPLFNEALSVSYHKKNLDYEYKLFIERKFVRFYIFEKINPFHIIGTLSYRDITHGCYDSCIIGYKMDRSKRRQGFCSEAISFMDKIVLNNYKLNRIEANIRVGNHASRSLLESIGYTNEGILRQKIKIDGKYLDHYLYSFLKSDL